MWVQSIYHSCIGCVYTGLGSVWPSHTTFLFMISKSIFYSVCSCTSFLHYIAFGPLYTYTLPDRGLRNGWILWLMLFKFHNHNTPRLLIKNTHRFLAFCLRDWCLRLSPILFDHTTQINEFVNTIIIFFTLYKEHCHSVRGFEFFLCTVILRTISIACSPRWRVFLWTSLNKYVA